MKNYLLMKMKNLVKSLMTSIMLVNLSLLLTLLRATMITLVYLPYKVLEKTNNLYQEVMERTCGLLSF